MIHLGPQSPSLNGLECWSVVKSTIKRKLSARQAELFVAPQGKTLVAHRLRIMREIAGETVNAELDPMLVKHCITHCRKHWRPLWTWVTYPLETDRDLRFNWAHVTQLTMCKLNRCVLL